MTRTLRPHQQRMLEWVAARPRCALWAKPGTGKTAVGLAYLDLVRNVLGDTRPALVVAPLRVARDVWGDEARRWPDTAAWRVVPVVGSAIERAAALAAPCEIHTINYENLPWLLRELAGAWPYGTVIADEATKLKSFRTRRGGVRAKALGKIAQRTDRWVNLTGTPASNGLQDVWGQTWFLDFGARLGRNYSNFQSRFFALPPHAGRFAQHVPRDNADAQIRTLLADLCLSVELEHLPQPQIVDVPVRMPDAARALYKTLERDMFAALPDGEEIESPSAAALTVKCLQLANGAVYTDHSGTWSRVHDAKLDALADLSEELQAPLLVAYHFKSDLSRLTTRFPDAADLSTPNGMAKFKAGDCALGFGHPASMGHGVDGLQYVCHNAAFFGHWWSLENSDQFIERIGPARQFQAGLNRAVTVYNIVATGTVDELVVKRRETKRGVQDALMQHLKGEP